MTIVLSPSGQSYDALPIDNAAGFPQRFPLLLNGVRYQFLLYVDVPEEALGPIDELMILPDARRFLVVRVDVIGPDGTQQPVFLRKVVPSLEYRTGGLAIYFPTQIVARRNLNNPGNFGSNVIGGVASL
jgi:hypothetical protein